MASRRVFWAIVPSAAAFGLAALVAVAGQILAGGRCAGDGFVMGPGVELLDATFLQLAAKGGLRSSSGGKRFSISPRRKLIISPRKTKRLLFRFCTRLSTF